MSYERIGGVVLGIAVALVFNLTGNLAATAFVYLAGLICFTAGRRCGK